LQSLATCSNDHGCPCQPYTTATPPGEPQGRGARDEDTPSFYSSQFYNVTEGEEVMSMFDIAVGEEGGREGGYAGRFRKFDGECLTFLWRRKGDLGAVWWDGGRCGVVVVEGVVAVWRRLVGCFGWDFGWLRWGECPPVD